MGCSVLAGVMLTVFDRPLYNPGPSENSLFFDNGIWWLKIAYLSDLISMSENGYFMIKIALKDITIAYNHMEVLSNP